MARTEHGFDDHIPVPSGNSRNPDSIDWGKAEIGHSRFFPAGEKVPRPSKDSGIVVKTRRVLENGKLGFRVWRINPEDKPPRKPRKRKALAEA